MLYTLLHKRVPYQQVVEGTKGLQVGDYAENITDLRDNTGDNITEWNPLVAENTGVYWIWKNDHDPVKGNCQYRRHLPLSKGLGNYKVRTCQPLLLSCSLWEQYSRFHSVKDMVLAENIIEQFFPEYSDSFRRYVKEGRYIYYSCGYMMNAEDYDRWCEFLFKFAGIFKECRNWNTVEDVRASVEQDIKNGVRNSVRGVRYQMQVIGFMAERLFTLWLLHNFKHSEIVTDKYELMERSGI